MSGSHGKKLFPLSVDHKPSDPKEMKRIKGNGGEVYQTKQQALCRNENGEDEIQVITGPHRIRPGRLSVSRSFGDIEAKLVSKGGNPNVLIADPEIKSFKIKP